MLKQLHDAGLMTHMPFLAPGEDGRPALLFCQTDAGTTPAGSRLWKAHYRTADGAIRRLAAGLLDDLCECSPTAWFDETGWHVTFIAGGGVSKARYHLYRLDGPALDRLGPAVAVHPTRTGFVHRDRLVWGDTENLVHVRWPLGTQEDKVVELPGAFIYRVAYRADATDKLLISGQWQQGEELFTLQYDLATDEQQIVTCDGEPAYKCTILGEQVLYTRRTGTHFEDRQVRAAARPDLQPSQIAVTRRPGEVVTISTVPLSRCRCGKGRKVAAAASDAELAPGVPAPSRPSCPECVHKHIGAAWVLISEHQNGYPHRLLAIGHLHEAEEESQAWPELHDTIREARKAYQRTGEVPDFERLASLVADIK